MNVEMTIQGMYDNYPDLFKTRADCYDHLFCTIGNGYAWKNGELVADDQEGSAPINPLKDGKAFQYHKISIREEHQQAFDELKTRDDFMARVMKNKNVEEFFAHRQREIMDLPDDRYYYYPRKYRWYFYTCISEYAKIFNVPADVKPDWKKAIAECKKMLKEDGYELKIPESKSLYVEKMILDEKKKTKMSRKGFYAD